MSKEHSSSTGEPCLGQLGQTGFIKPAEQDVIMVAIDVNNNWENVYDSQIDLLIMMPELTGRPWYIS